jgi:hypothetical protein
MYEDQRKLSHTATPLEWRVLRRVSRVTNRAVRPDAWRRREDGHGSTGHTEVIVRKEVTIYIYLLEA